MKKSTVFSEYYHSRDFVASGPVLSCIVSRAEAAGEETGPAACPVASSGPSIASGRPLTQSASLNSVGTGSSQSWKRMEKILAWKKILSWKVMGKTIYGYLSKLSLFSVPTSYRSNLCM